jgi:hypothetical protein
MEYFNKITGDRRLYDPNSKGFKDLDPIRQEMSKRYWALMDAGNNGSGLRLMLLIEFARRTNKTNDVVNGIPPMAFCFSYSSEYAKFGLRESQNTKLRRTVKWLVKHKYIEVVQKGTQHRATIYRIIDHDIIDVRMIRSVPETYTVIDKFKVDVPVPLTKEKKDSKDKLDETPQASRLDVDVQNNLNNKSRKNVEKASRLEKINPAVWNKESRLPPSDDADSDDTISKPESDTALLPTSEVFDVYDPIAEYNAEQIVRELMLSKQLVINFVRIKGQRINNPSSQLENLELYRKIKEIYAKTDGVGQLLIKIVNTFYSLDPIITQNKDLSNLNSLEKYLLKKSSEQRMKSLEECWKDSSVREFVGRMYKRFFNKNIQYIEECIKYSLSVGKEEYEENDELVQKWGLRRYKFMLGEDHDEVADEYCGYQLEKDWDKYWEIRFRIIAEGELLMKVKGLKYGGAAALNYIESKVREINDGISNSVYGLNR